MVATLGVILEGVIRTTSTVVGIGTKRLQFQMILETAVVQSGMVVVTLGEEEKVVVVAIHLEVVTVATLGEEEEAVVALIGAEVARVNLAVKLAVNLAMNFHLTRQWLPHTTGWMRLFSGSLATIPLSPLWTSAQRRWELLHGLLGRWSSTPLSPL